MIPIAVRRVAEIGQPLLAQTGAPDLYRQLINEYWQQRASGEVLVVQPEHRDDIEWSALGVELTDALISLGTQSGLSFDGQLPFDVESVWLQRFAQLSDPSIITLRIIKSQHPTHAGILIRNVQWNSVQSAHGRSWLSLLWNDAKSMWFNQGLDLLLSVYDRDIISQIGWDKPLDLNVFGQTLRHAIAWMLPLDENIGFLIGLPIESIIYQSLSTQLL